MSSEYQDVGPFGTPGQDDAMQISLRKAAMRSLGQTVGNGPYDSPGKIDPLAAQTVPVASGAPGPGISVDPQAPPSKPISTSGAAQNTHPGANPALSGQAPPDVRPTDTIETPKYRTVRTSPLGHAFLGSRHAIAQAIGGAMLGNEQEDLAYNQAQHQAFQDKLAMQQAQAQAEEHRAQARALEAGKGLNAQEAIFQELIKVRNDPNMTPEEKHAKYEELADFGEYAGVQRPPKADTGSKLTGELGTLAQLVPKRAGEDDESYMARLENHWRKLQQDQRNPPAPQLVQGSDGKSYWATPGNPTPRPINIPEPAQPPPQQGPQLPGSSQALPDQPGAPVRPPAPVVSFTKGSANRQLSPDEIDQTAKLLANGNLSALNTISSMRNADRTRIFLRATQYNPSFNTSEVNRKVDMYKDATVGDGGKMLQAFGTFLDHASALKHINEEFERTNSPLANRPIVWLEKNAAGDPQIQRYLTAMEPVKKEFESVLLNNRALYESDRKSADSLVGPNLSARGMNAAIGQMGNTVIDRATEYNSRFKSVVGQDMPLPFSPHASESAKHIGLDLGKITGRPAVQTPPAAGTPVAKAPPGTPDGPYTYRGSPATVSNGLVYAH